MRRRMSRAADRPVAGAAARHEHRRAPVLLGGAGGGRIAGAADGLPRRLRELVGAVEPVAGVGGVVAARLAGADRGELAAGVAAAGGGLPRRARPRDLTTQAPVRPDARIRARLVGRAAVGAQQAVVLVV